MSVFLSIILLALAALTGGIAVASWQKGGYRNYVLALEWGIGTWLLLGLGAVVTYYAYVLIPARNPPVVETIIRGLLSPAVVQTPTPQKSGEAKSAARDDIVIRFGSSLAFFSEPAATLFRCGDEDILSFERVRDGVYVNAVIYNETGEEVARITKNIFRAKSDNRYFVLNPNPHTLEVIGPDDQRMFSVEYLNPRVIKILGIFRCKTPSVPWVIEEGRIFGGGGITMSNSQIVLDKGTALDILHATPGQQQSK